MDGVKSSQMKMTAKAAATRTRIIEAAYELFCENGYRATTMEAIGRAAGVAVQTVYFTFHTKDDLLLAVHEWTVLGDDPTPPPLQEWHVAAMREADAPRALAGIVAGVATLNARMAPMLPVFHAVSQSKTGDIYRRSQATRRDDMKVLVAALSRKTPLAPRMTRGRAIDLVYFLMGPESYAGLVLDAGWSTREWVRWTSDTLNAQLFDAGTAAP
jgi:AcrR family transcriptional regulator